MKIAIAETGYVGLSNDLLLAQHNEVIIYKPVFEDEVFFMTRRVNSSMQGIFAARRLSGKFKIEYLTLRLDIR